MMLLLSSFILADGTDDLNVIYQWTGFGNYIANGNPLSGGACTVSTMSIPAGATPVRAYLYLHHLNQSLPDAATRNGTFSGSPVTLSWVGVSSGWGYQLYRADITSLISGPAVHNVAISSPEADDHAAFIVLIYQDLTQTCMSTVIIADGENRWRWDAGGGQRMATVVDMDWNNANPVGSTPQVYATFIGSAGGVSNADDRDRWGVFPDSSQIPANALWESEINAINNSQGQGLDLDTYDVSGGFTTGQSIAYMWAYEKDTMHTSWTVSVLRNVNCDVTAVSVQKTIDKTVVALNDTITYCFEITNSAFIPQSFDLWDTIPAVTSYAGCDNGCVVDGSSTVVSWPMITVNAGSTRTVCFWVVADQYPYFEFRQLLASLRDKHSLYAELRGAVR